MQLELALTDCPVVGPTLWEQLDPAVREAVIDRLAQAIAAAAAATPNPTEDPHHESARQGQGHSRPSTRC